MKSDFPQAGQAMIKERMPAITSQASDKGKTTAKINCEDKPNALRSNGTPQMIANIATNVPNMWRRAVRYTLPAFSLSMAIR
ncbi:MAG: hypothetical protein ACLGIM_05795 [Alphaproteobacteria bacterium]